MAEKKPVAKIDEKKKSNALPAIATAGVLAYLIFGGKAEAASGVQFLDRIYTVIPKQGG